MKPVLLVSGCLMGLHCRYDGALQPPILLKPLMDKFTLIPVCPEQLGGLPTPRVPAERKGQAVLAKTGTDVTAQYFRGAEETLQLAKLYGCKTALLKKRSPSCGVGTIYDGTFSMTLIPGNGVTAELLLQNGIAVYDETQIDILLNNG